MADLSVYQRYVPLSEALKANEAQALHNKLVQAQTQRHIQAAATGGGSTPAALQIADRMLQLEKVYKNPNASQQERESALREYNLIGQAAKTYGFERLTEYGTPQTNHPQLHPVFQDMPELREIGGASDIMAQRAAKKRMAETQAQKDVELEMNPNIERATKSAAQQGTSEGKGLANLQESIARAPHLMNMVGRLSQLGKAATYTLAGQARDTFIRQMGRDVPNSAVARREYISMVDNDILPLLRQTFGAQFTAREGDSLRQTLGDANASPREKDAVLRSFIRTKMENINTQARMLGKEQPFNQEMIDSFVMGIGSQPKQARQHAQIQRGAVEDGYMYLGGDPSNQKSWKKVR